MGVTTSTNNVVINKLSVEDYRAIKGTAQENANEVYNLKDIEAYLGKYTIRNIEGLDLNTLIGEVIVGYGNDLINKPENANGYLINIPHALHPTTYNRQYYQSRHFNTLYTRFMENGVWSAWKKVFVDKDYLMASLTSTHTIPSNGDGVYYTLPLTSKCLIGDGLSVTSDGGIKIGGVIRGIKISGQVTFTPAGSAANKHIRIYCNDDVIGWANAKPTATNELTTLSIPSIIHNVKTGDVIYLKYYGKSGDTVTGGAANPTHLTVEAIV